MKHIFRLKRTLVLFFCIATLAGCATTGNGSSAEKRQVANKMRAEVLSELYKLSRMFVAKLPVRQDTVCSATSTLICL